MMKTPGLTSMLQITAIGVVVQFGIGWQWYVSKGMASLEAFTNLAPVLPGLVYATLPVAAAVAAAGVYQASPDVARPTFWRLAIIASLAMVVVDAATPAAYVERRQVAAMTQVAVSTADMEAYEMAGVSFTRAALEVWNDPEIHERGRSYAADHPRRRASRAAKKAGVLFLPAVLMAFIVATLRWMRAGVRFVRPGDEYLVGTIVAWVIAFSAYFVVYRLAEKGRVASLYGEAPLAVAVTPFIGAAVLAIAVWAAAARITVSVEKTWVDRTGP